MRNPLFDVAKFVAMFMVVFGHVQTASVMIWGAPYIKNLIIGVNMPLFFAISGYFTSNMKQKEGRYLAIRILTLLWPALLASAVFGFIKMCLCPDMGLSVFGWVWGKFLSFWFLWTLSICYVASYVADKMNFKGGGVLATSTVFVLMMATRDGMLWVDETLQMFPYFLFGRYLMDDCLRAIERNAGFGVFCLVAYAVVVSFSGDVYANGLGFYWNHVSYRELVRVNETIVFWVARFAVGIMGIVAVFAVLIQARRRFRVVDRIAVLGTTTLGVYILHQNILAQFTALLSSSLICVILVSIVLFASCHLVVVVSKKIKMVNVVVWGLPKVILEGRKG